MSPSPALFSFLLQMNPSPKAQPTSKSPKDSLYFLSAPLSQPLIRDRERDWARRSEIRDRREIQRDSESRSTTTSQRRSEIEEETQRLRREAQRRRRLHRGDPVVTDEIHRHHDEQRERLAMTTEIEEEIGDDDFAGRFFPQFLSRLLQTFFVFVYVSSTKTFKRPLNLKTILRTLPATTLNNSIQGLNPWGITCYRRSGFSFQEMVMLPKTLVRMTSLGKKNSFENNKIQDCFHNHFFQFTLII